MLFQRVISYTSTSLIAAIALFSTAAFGQIEAANLQPLGEWQVRVMDDRCIIHRSFGDPSSPTTLELRSIDPWSGGFQVAILTAGYSTTGESFRAGWLPGGRIAEVDRITMIEADEGTTGILFSHGLWDGGMETTVVGRDGPFNVLEVDPEYDFEAEPRLFRQGIQGFLVLGAFETPLMFATGPMDRFWEQRDDCMDQVLISQGVDPSDADRDDHRVEMTNRQTVTSRALRRVPDNIGRRDRPTMITFLLYVDANAQPSSCRLVSLPYDAEYEQRSCELLMRRAEFEFKEGEAARPTFVKVSGFYAP